MQGAQKVKTASKIDVVTRQGNRMSETGRINKPEGNGGAHYSNNSGSLNKRALDPENRRARMEHS